jgi:HEAT repeat protein
MSIQTIRAALGVAALAVMSQAHSDELKLPRDGWTSWQVAAVDGAPDWCCWNSWDDKNPTTKACSLDDDHGNFGSRNHKTTDAVRVYARTAGGKIERLRVLSATCPVEAKTPIHELGGVATEDSTRWLIGLTKQSGTDSVMRGEGGESVLAGLAMHQGSLAQDALATIARGDTRTEARKKAVFWLAMLRGTAGADIATSVMFNDKDPQLREHASFAVAQSKSPRIAEDLTRLGNTDTDGQVRAQAWFWLAHTGATGAEDAIAAALKKDKDDHVREHAVFALSRLPDERATRALIAVAEDKTLTREQRKRAVFWLAQSEAAGAQKYLEKVLVGKVGD